MIVSNMLLSTFLYSHRPLLGLLYIHIHNNEVKFKSNYYRVFVAYRKSVRYTYSVYWDCETASFSS